MHMLKKIKKILKNPTILVLHLGNRGFLNWIPDDLYLKLVFFSKIGKKLDLNNPKTFNEKLQWLKLNDRNNQYINLVDKYEVRKYIEKNIGSQYLIPLIGVYNSFDDINFDILPDSFVLKCTHDSGGVIVCKNKKNFNKEKAKKSINKWMKRNYFYGGREWPYKNINPRIICEKYMVDDSGIELKDYKIMCFNGEPKVIQYHCDRFIKHRQYHYDIEGNLLPFNNQGYSNEGAPKLDMDIINKMLPLSRKLSEKIKHVRVDFYFINGQVYFGELTFYDASGFEPIVPEEYDYILGSWIDV